MGRSLFCGELNVTNESYIFKIMLEQEIRKRWNNNWHKQISANNVDGNYQTPDVIKEKHINQHSLFLVKHSAMKSASKLFGVSKRYIGR